MSTTQVEKGITLNPIVKYTSADVAKLFGIRYIGDEASGLIDTATTTSDLIFTHGDLGSEAADTSVAGNGTIDLSGEAATFAAIKAQIDSSPNWEFWYLGALPTDASEASGTGKILDLGSATQAKTDAGVIFYGDRSATLYHVAGITRNGPSVGLHNTDAGCKISVRYIEVTLTYSDGNHSVILYEVDDAAGTATALATWTAAATTETLKIPISGTPAIISSVYGKRLVVKQLSDTAEPTAWNIEVWGEIEVLEPTVHANNLYCRK